MLVHILGSGLHLSHSEREDLRKENRPERAADFVALFPQGNRVHGCPKSTRETLCGVGLRSYHNISPDGRVHIVFGPDRTIRETDFASQSQFAAVLAHLPYSRRYAVCVFETERFDS